VRLLLDTHIWLWSLLEPPKLGRRVLRVLRAEATELWLSPVSIWEFLVLVEQERIALGSDPQDWLDRALATAPMFEAPLTHDIARESRRLSLPHEDPADRFLAATAKVLELTLVTADERLASSGEIEVMRNR